MKTYVIGSKLLCLLNCHDRDVLMIVDEGDVNQYKRECRDGVDLVTRSTANINRQMNFELPITYVSARQYIINYQLDADIIKQDFPFKYHILNRRDKYIELLKWIVENEGCNFVKRPSSNHGNCSKMIYHVSYTLFIVENNSTILTAEQKAIVQKIHDCEMSQDYLDVLAEKIRNLK